MGNGDSCDPSLKAFLVCFRVASPIHGEERGVATKSALMAVDGGYDLLRVRAVRGEYLPVRDDPVLHLVHPHLPAEFAGRPELALDDGAHLRLEDGDDAVPDLLPREALDGLADEDVGEAEEALKLFLCGKGREITDAAQLILDHPSPLRHLLRDFHDLTS